MAKAKPAPKGAPSKKPVPMKPMPSKPVKGAPGKKG